MKRLEEFTRQELLDMTDESREELADLECAYDSIPLLPPRPEKPEIVYPERDVTVYTVDDYVFTDLSEAQQYCQYVNGLTSLVRLDYEYSNGLSSEFKYVNSERHSEAKYETKKVYSKDTFDGLKADLVKLKALERAYSERYSDYKKALDERAAIYKKIDDAVSGAWEEKYREDKLVGAYKKYQELTGDGAVALKLLKDAYQITEEEERAIPEIAKK